MIKKTELPYGTIWEAGRHIVVKDSTGQYRGGAVHYADCFGPGEHAYSMSPLAEVTTDDQAEGWLKEFGYE